MKRYNLLMYIVLGGNFAQANIIMLLSAGEYYLIFI